MCVKLFFVVIALYLCHFSDCQDVTEDIETATSTTNIPFPDNETTTTAEVNIENTTTIDYNIVVNTIVSTEAFIPDIDNTTEILEEVQERATTEAIMAGEKKMSEYLLEILEKLKNPNIEGIPGVEIPEPYPIPDIKYPITFFDVLYLEKIAVHGISKIRVSYVNVDFEDMKVDAAMYINKLQVHGTYRYSSLLMPKSGPFTIEVLGLKITPIQASLGVEIDGKLKSQDINIDLSYESVDVKFENLGSLGFINSIGSLILDLIKPSVLQEAHTKARIAIDEKLEEVADKIEFPNSIAPLDMVLVDARRKVREINMDPYKVNDFNSTISDTMAFLSLTLSHTWITGLSTFHRIGEMSLKLENNTVIANFEIGTQKLEGKTRWEIAVSSLMSFFGTASFSVEYISSRIVIAQSLDTREKPDLQHIHLDVGNIQARCDGAGTMDYIIESVVNILPNILRYQIVAGLEGPLKNKLQEELNSVNIDEEIKLAAPRIDELAEKVFKLSYLRVGTEETCNSDEFFNF